MDKNLEKGVLTFSEKVLIYIFICLSFYELARASYWIINPDAAVNDSPLYLALAEIAPLWVWGLPFLVCAICLIICAMTIYRQSISITFSVSFLLAGIFGFLSHLLVSSAAINNSLNWITPVQNTALAIMFLLFIIIGIESTWKKITNR